MGKPRELAIIVVMVAAASGCGDDDDDSATGDRVSTLIQAEEGGTLVSADGALRVTIPPGALSADTEVSIETSDAAPPPGALSAVYDIGPTGLHFEEPVTLELAYEEQTLQGRSPQALHVAFSTNDGLAWSCITFSAVEEATHQVLAAIDHFSQHVLRFNPCDEDGDCSAPETCRLEAAEGYCALECEDRTDCPFPLDCFCGVCGRQPCRGGDDECTAWETHACSIHEGPGVCHPPCANEGDACGSTFDAGQQSCTPGLHCTFDAVCADPFETPFDCAAATSCVHGWCIPNELGCAACDDGVPREAVCDDLDAEDCVSAGDEDGDGLAGCADDEDCGTDPLCPAPPEDCDLPGDEDGNGRADCADPACAAEPQCDDAYQGVPVLGVATKAGTTCAVTEGGALRCWGRPKSGVTGQGNADIIGDEPGELAALPPIDLGSDRTATAVVLGYAHACALLDDSSVKCWGSNGSGELGQGDTEVRGDEPGEMGDALPPVDLGAGRSVQALSGGSYHTCAILDDGTVKCWGDNFLGRLGLGDELDRGDAPAEMGDDLPVVDLGTGRTATAMGCGRDGCCVLLDDQTVKCWGQDLRGFVGQGDDAANYGDEPGEMGDALPTVDLGTGALAEGVFATSGTSACALLSGGVLKCWGENFAGNLGLGDLENRGDDPGEMGDALPAIDLGAGRSVVTMDPGQAQMCAVLDDGSVKCWGSYAEGGLGNDLFFFESDNQGDEAGEMGDVLPAVDLGTGRTAITLVTSSLTSCVILDDRGLKCWGQNVSGQLGLGDVDSRGDEPGEMGDALPYVDLGP